MDIKEQLKLKNPGKIAERIVEFIKNQVDVLNKEGIIIGLSGGIDSALGAFLSVKALGKEKVLALFMPERDSSSKSEKDAKLVADLLGIKFKKINLTPILRTVGIYKLYPPAFLIPKKIQEMYALKKYKDLGSNNETSLLKNLKGGKGEKELKKGIAYYRIKHRLRMVMWYYYGELNNYLVVGNCNKTEKLTGFFVKHGDSAADVEPISSLFKTQVRELSSFLGVPREIIKKAPSPDLIPGITDENAIQMKLEKLDQILYGLENKIKEEEIKKETGATEKEIQYVKELMRWSLPMRELPFAPCLGDLL